MVYEEATDSELEPEREETTEIEKIEEQDKQQQQQKQQTNKIKTKIFDYLNNKDAERNRK